jgi:hypothetical protein
MAVTHWPEIGDPDCCEMENAAVAQVRVRVRVRVCGVGGVGWGGGDGGQSGDGSYALAGDWRSRLLRDGECSCSTGVCVGCVCGWGVKVEGGWAGSKRAGRARTRVV